VLLVGGRVSIEAQGSRAVRQNSSRSERSAVLVKDGAAALDKGDLATARSFFERALAASPQNVEAHTYLGILADRADDLATAQRHFAAAVAAAPALPSAHNNHGATLLRLGRTAQAAAEFETSLRLNPDQPSALVNLAQIRFATGTPEGLRQSRALFERAWTIAPDAEIASSLVITALRQKDTAAATIYFRRYAEMAGTATGGKLQPSVRVELATALLDARLLSEAIEELNAATAAEPNNVNVILLLARAHLARKDIPAAGRVLEAAVARGIQTGQIYAALADVYEQSGHIENAIPAMRLAIEQDPKSESYRFRYGMLLTDTQAPAAAVIRLNEALQIFPRSPRLWFALGIAHFAAHKSDEAAQAFQRALEMDSGFVPALSYLGLISREQGRSAEALNFYEQALALDAKLAVVHYLAADALLWETTPDFKRVESHLLRSIAMEPSFAPSLLALGKLYFRTNRLDEAAKLLERAIALQPDLAEPHYQLGRVYVRLKRQPEGLAELAKFKELSEGQKEQAQNERRDIVRRLAKVVF
jgi:tetratricopeptide (TPR) repeat protein